MKIVKNKEQRVAVLVDVQNMYYSARSLFDSKVNFGELLKIAVSGRQLVRAIAYVITTGEEDEKEKSFFDALYKTGFDIKDKEIQIFKGGAKKGDWDVGIAIDAISMAEKVDSIILFSGDGDYIPLIEYLKLAKGCSVEVVAFGQTCSHKLKEIADFFIDIEEGSSQYLISSRYRSKPVGTRRTSSRRNTSRTSAHKPQEKVTPMTVASKAPVHPALQNPISQTRQTTQTRVEKTEQSGAAPLKRVSFAPDTNATTRFSN